MIPSVLFYSKSCEWNTPDCLFDELNSEFRFNLDVCATPENAKCERFFTKEDDGLSQSWDGCNVWCNPPYNKEITKWTKKACETKNAVICMLLPARTDTKWFHDYVLGKASEIRFIKGRLRFSGYSRGRNSKRHTEPGRYIPGRKWREEYDPAEELPVLWGTSKAMG